MAKKITYLMLFFASFLVLQEVQATCNWKNRTPYFTSWDSCINNSNTKRGSINAYIAFQYNTSCFRYTWKINGNIVSTGSNVLHYNITQNGTYNISLVVRDTCNNCDTTFTGSKTISCFTTCNWKAKNITILAQDSCNQYPYKPSIYAFVYGNIPSCAKYIWKVNGNKVGTNAYMDYKATQNGTYTLTLNVRDTCNNCDTTYSKSISISCANPCKWFNRNITLSTWDSCAGKGKNKVSINAEITNNSCYKYSWSVNNSTVLNGPRIINYGITKNGTYNLCVKVYDSCNKCDTTFCRSFNVTCVSNTGCYMPYQRPSYKLHCDSLFYESGNIDTCVTYMTRRYSVNTGKLDTLSYSRVFSTVFKDTGTYYLITSYHNKCKGCDTAIYTKIHVTCKTQTSNCRWANSSRQIYFAAWDSCSGKGKNKISINGYIGPFAGCYKYSWLVNGVKVSSDRMLNYGITKNGTYNLCMKIMDTCSKCDTTYCKSFNITCVSNAPCYMPYQRPGYKLNCDTIVYESGNIDTCVTYLTRRYTPATGKVDTISNKRVFSFIFKDTGVYYFITSYHNKCKNCDTSIYTRLHVTCKTPSSNCRWANSNRQIYFSAWDSCNGRGKNKVSLNGYIGPFNGCYKYKWKVNGYIVSDSRFLNYGITKNGTYNVCMTILDTCTKCDTTYCKSFNISCISTCNWKSRISANNFYDSCNGKGYANSLNGYVAMNQNYKTSCYKYRWTINGALVSNTYYFHAPIYMNGAYNVCVKITDTCTQCDTTICSRRVVNCNNLGLKNGSNLQVKIYPNPASNELNIDLSSSTESAELLSIDGKTIWSGSLNEGKNQMNTEQWARGIYILRVKTVSGINNYKITLE